MACVSQLLPVPPDDLFSPDGWFAYLAEWDLDREVRFCARGESPAAAREELAQAREAWREEAGERAWERNRAGWAWIEGGTV